MKKNCNHNNSLFGIAEIKQETNPLIKEIVSGGQTGVDRAALDVAIALSIPHSGWCPKNRKAEDGSIPSKYKLNETASESYEERTEQNVIDSDGTLIIVKDAPIGGTLYTIEKAENHKKPYLISQSGQDDTQKITDWIVKNNILKLNIAGPRASQTENIYNIAYEIVMSFLKPKLSLQNIETPKNN